MKSTGTQSNDSKQEICIECFGTGYLGFKSYPSYKIEDCAFCECEIGKAARQEAEAEAHRLQEKGTRKRIEEAQIPTRFQHFTLDSYEQVAQSESQKRTLSLARQLAEHGRIQGKSEARSSLYLYSIPSGDEKSPGYGVGKTAICTGIMLEWLKQGKRCYWFEAKSLLSYIRLGVREGDYEERKKRLKEVEVLLIDDLGEVWKVEEKDTGREAITEIIAHRHDWELATLITSNLGTDTMSKQYSAKIAERIGEMCAVVEIKGPNLRKTAEIKAR